MLSPARIPRRPGRLDGSVLGASVLVVSPLVSRLTAMPNSSPRHLLPIVVAYLPVPLAGAILSSRWKVGASPEGGPADMFLRGTALTPPLFLPAVLVGAAAVAPRSGTAGRVGAGVVSVIALAFLAGSTANLPNDFKAADAAGTPRRLTAALAAIHVVLAGALLVNAIPRLRGRERA